MATKTYFGDIFVLNFTDFLCFEAFNSSTHYVVKIFDNGYLFHFTSLPAYFLFKIGFGRWKYFLPMFDLEVNITSVTVDNNRLISRYAHHNFRTGFLVYL